MENNQRLYDEDDVPVRRGHAAVKARPRKHVHSWTPWGLPAEVMGRTAGWPGTRRSDWERRCRVCGKTEHGFWLLGRDRPDIAACHEHQYVPDTWATDRGKMGGLLVEHRLRCSVCGEVDRASVVRRRGRDA